MKRLLALVALCTAAALALGTWPTPAAADGGARHSARPDQGRGGHHALSFFFGSRPGHAYGGHRERGALRHHKPPRRHKLHRHLKLKRHLKLHWRKHLRHRWRKHLRHRWFKHLRHRWHRHRHARARSGPHPHQYRGWRFGYRTGPGRL